MNPPPTTTAAAAATTSTATAATAAATTTSFFKSPYTTVDVFPKTVSDKVKQLEYPEKNSEFYSSRTMIFLLFKSEDNNKIYFQKRDWTDNKYYKNLEENCRLSKILNTFEPHKVNLHKLNAFMIKPADRATKQTNTDKRIFYKRDNEYMVKHGFTFGQRTVQEDQAHVIQTLEVPLLFYVLDNNNKRINVKISKVDRIFPYNHMHMYQRFILLPFSCYRIPPGTTYLILTVQKTFFSLHLVKADFEIPMSYKDPLIERTRKFEPESNVYDKPLKTPYLDDLSYNYVNDDISSHENHNSNPQLEALFQTLNESSSDTLMQQQQQPPKEYQEEEIMDGVEQSIYHQPPSHELRTIDFHQPPPPPPPSHEFQTIDFQTLSLEQQQFILDHARRSGGGGGGGGHQEPTSTEMMMEEYYPEQQQRQQSPDIVMMMEHREPVTDTEIRKTEYYPQQQQAQVNPWLLQRQIVVASPDFVKSYHYLTNKIWDNPIPAFYPSQQQTVVDQQSQLLNLCMKDLNPVVEQQQKHSNIDIPLEYIDFENVIEKNNNSNKYDEVLAELFAI